MFDPNSKDPSVNASSSNESSSMHQLIQHITKKQIISYVVTLVVSIIIMILIVRCFVLDINLKYNWGTSYDKVYENEFILATHEPKELDFDAEYRLLCDDPERSVDKIEGFDVDDNEVTYIFDSSKKLQEIYYFFDKMSIGSRVLLVSEYYGDDYYIIEDYNRAYWWINNTVVELGSNIISYYNARWFIETAEDNIVDEVRDHFGK